LGAFVPAVDGATGAAIPAKGGGFSGLGDLVSLYSTYKPWLWIAGAIAGLIYARKLGWLDEG
jgi:hypothetical protein